MDKSVAQKFTIVMAMFIAMFATVFVCGNIVGGGFTSDSYMQPLAKSSGSVSYSDQFIDGSNYVNRAVSSSDLYENQNVTIVEFIDDDAVESVVTSAQNFDVDEEYLYMTTVTTTGSLSRQATTSAAKTTSRKTTSAAKSTSSTTAATTASTAATTKQTTASTAKTTASKPTTAATLSTTTTTSAPVTVTTATAKPTTETVAATKVTEATSPSASTNETSSAEE